MDWCHHPDGLTQQELYTNFSNALKATGREMYFSICGWGLNEPWTWAPKISSSWRTGPDHVVLWYLKNGTQGLWFCFLLLTPIFLCEDPGHSGGTANIIQQQAGLSPFGGPYKFNDPDFIEIEWFSSNKEIQTQVSFWSLFAAPLVVANDPRKEHVRKALMNDDMIAVSQDALVRGGDIRIGKGSAGQVWSRELSSGWLIFW